MKKTDALSASRLPSMLSRLKEAFFVRRLHQPYVFSFWLFVVIGLAFAFPEPASRGRVLHVDIVTQLGVWVIFFGQGLLFSARELVSGFNPKRLHSFVLGWNYLFFPLVTGVVLLIFGSCLSDDLKLGFYLLAILPTTVASSTAFTALSGGDVSNAIFSTVYSNLLAAFLVPAFVVGFLVVEGESTVELSSLIVKLFWLVLFPLLTGQCLRRVAPAGSAVVAGYIRTLCLPIILFIVYAAFAGSVSAGSFNELPWIRLVSVLLLSVVLLFLVSAVVWMSSGWLKLQRHERIASFFCASQKSLAVGLPLIASILAVSGHGVYDSAFLLFPMMCYHPLQLILADAMSRRFDRSRV